MSNDAFGRFEAVILCDDIRQEGNGKYLLIGVYSGDIVVTAFPAYLSLRLFAEYRCQEIGTHQLDFRWFLDDEEVVNLEGTVTQSNTTLPIPMALPEVPLDLHKNATLSIRASNGDGDMMEVYRRNIFASDGA